MPSIWIMAEREFPTFITTTENGHEVFCPKLFILSCKGSDMFLETSCVILTLEKSGGEDQDSLIPDLEDLTLMTMIFCFLSVNAA